MNDAYIVVDQFFDGANELRSAFEKHFSEPEHHAHEHQVWNYWYVPDSYTYLKTNPTRIMPVQLIERLLTRVNSWASEMLGLSTDEVPWLSLYVDGCGQTIHNDSLAGNMGYVFSITKWDTRNFLGGETLLFRPENYWETGRMKHSGAGVTFYDKIPSRFNQLLVFDDRVIHGVQRLEGTMEPLQGRVVIHGHLRPVLLVTGALTTEQAADVMTSTLESIDALADEHTELFHGFVTLRLSVNPDGQIARIRPLIDRLLPLTPDKSKLEPLRRSIVEKLTSVRLPSASGPTEITIPVVIGAEQ